MYKERTDGFVQNEAIEKAWKNYENLRNSQEVLDAETELYRHFDAWDRLLYVGISCSSAQRYGQHKDQSEWSRLVCKITIERWPTRELALLAETQAIRAERPYFNKRGALMRRKWVRPDSKRHVDLCGNRNCSGCLP